MQSRSRRRSQGRSRGRLDRAAAPTREQEGRSERPPCAEASGLWGRRRGQRRSRRGRAQGCHHWRRRAQAIHQPTSLGGSPLLRCSLRRQAGWRRGRAHAPGRRRCRDFCRAPRRRRRRAPLRRRRARALWRARHRRPASCRRWRGFGAGRHGAARPPPSPSIRRPRPVRWRRRRRPAVASSNPAFGRPFWARRRWGRLGRRATFCRPRLGPTWSPPRTSGRWGRAGMVCLCQSEWLSTRI